MARERDNGAGVSAARCYSLAPKNAGQVTASEGAFRTDPASERPALPDARPPFGAGTCRQ
jgi:hypothetical protein